MSESQPLGAPPPEPQPGAGAAFWAARGVRIEPEPEDYPDEEAPAFEAQGPQDPDMVPESAWDPGAEASRRPAEERSTAAQAPAALAPPPGPTALPVPFVPAQNQGGRTDLTPPPAAPDYAGQETADQGAAGPTQVPLDEVEPQSGDVVDGLAALGASMAEARRARAAAEPEPAWQLAEGGLTPMPPLRACLEAILMVVDEPVTDVVLAQVVERPKSEVAQTLRELAEEYTVGGRGFELREVGVGDSGGTGWRIYSRAECAPVVEKFVRDGQQARLTQAALETLAVVAYRQPVSRSKVSAIRGVNCDGVMRTLLARGLVEESGTEHETGALLYRTTGYFLERMNLKSLLELPDLAPLLPSVADLEDEQY
ncbi:MAG TPA: SMC-Scp complex subunit ScpB [Actinocrinis sp.]